nr:hypothetical protein [Bacilli bacterium]
MNVKKMSMIIIGAVALILLGGAGTYEFLLKPPSKPVPPSAAQLQSWQYQVDKLTTNLQGGNMIQIQFTLQAPNSNVLAELTSRASQVDDGILSILNSLSASEILQPGGYTYLKDLIIKKINGFLTTGKIINVYVNNSIIQ